MKSSYGPELLPKKVSQRKKLEVRGGLFDLYGGGGEWKIWEKNFLQNLYSKKKIM